MQFVIETDHNMVRKLLIIVLVTHTQAGKYFSPEVSVKQGNLRGPRLHTRKDRDVFAFEEIPYAKRLLEDLRFRVRQKISCHYLSEYKTVLKLPTCLCLLANRTAQTRYRAIQLKCSYQNFPVQ
jgi:hypothetical protein